MFVTIWKFKKLIQKLGYKYDEHYKSFRTEQVYGDLFYLTKQLNNLQHQMRLLMDELGYYYKEQCDEQLPKLVKKGKK